jgi:SAGA-associated factor 29
LGIQLGRTPREAIEMYPAGSVVDFRKLEEPALRKYVAHYNVNTKPDISREDLALVVARHFQLEAKRIDDEATINVFLASYDRAFGKALGYEPAAKRPKVTSSASSRGFSNENNLWGPAKENETVAAHLVEGGEESWILALVKKYFADKDEFDVVDVEDLSKRIRLKRDDIVRLEENIGQLQKGDAVLAVFPDTTSFYKGRISKPVKNKGVGGDIYVQFEEDEDESGRTPHRRVPARHVMADPDEEYDEEEAIER